MKKTAQSSCIKKQVLEMSLDKIGLKLEKAQEMVDGGQLASWKIVPRATAGGGTVWYVDPKTGRTRWCYQILCGSLEDVEECLLNRIKLVDIGKVSSPFFGRKSLEEVLVDSDLTE